MAEAEGFVSGGSQPVKRTGIFKELARGSASGKEDSLKGVPQVRTVRWRPPARLSGFDLHNV